MEDVIHTGASFGAIVQVADVAFDEGEIRPLFWGYQRPNFVQIVLVAGGEVVQPHYTLIQLEQVFQKIGADKTGNTCDQPSSRIA